jgi:hypothetical protein
VDAIPASWLYRQVSRDEAERIFADDRGVPFGPAHSAWNTLTANLSAADTIWIYDSQGKPGAACRQLGVCIVRHGHATRHLLVRIG